MPTTRPCASTSAPPSAVRLSPSVEPDEAVDGAAARAVPRAARDRDDAEAGDRRALVISDRQDDVAGAQRGRVDGLRRRQAVRLEAQHRDVGGGIATRQRRIDDAPARERDLDAVVALQHFLGGDDDAGAPMNAARGAAAAAMNRDDAGGGALDHLRGVIRKGDERIV